MFYNKTTVDWIIGVWALEYVTYVTIIKGVINNEMYR